MILSTKIVCVSTNKMCNITTCVGGMGLKTMSVSLDDVMFHVVSTGYQLVPLERTRALHSVCRDEDETGQL